MASVGRNNARYRGQNAGKAGPARKTKGIHQPARGVREKRADSRQQTRRHNRGRRLHKTED
eukprot:6317652-Alexandrium_andersonii.AAC.1